MILHPLSQVLMYALVLSAILSSKLPGIDNRFSYAIYLTAGILAWSLFSDLISSCLTLFIDKGNLMKRVMFPKICLPLIVSGFALINNLLLLVCILIIFMLLGHNPSIELIWLPFLFLVTLGLGLGLGLMLGILNVFIRDVGQIVPILLQFGFWFTPIVYMVTIIPEQYRAWLALNPMYHITSGFQNVLVYHQPPDWPALLLVAIASIMLMGIAMFMFRKASPEMVDVL